MRHRMLLGCALALVFGCDSGSGGGGGGGDAGTFTHIVSSGALTYAETAEATNGTTAGAETTGYTLDATGAIFSGSFEASSPTTDCFRYDTGSASAVDVRVVVDGQVLSGNPGSVFLSLDAVPNDGYSALTGNDYFIHAWESPSTAFRICATSSSANGKTYQIELRASP